METVEINTVIYIFTSEYIYIYMNIFLCIYIYAPSKMESPRQSLELEN